MNFLKKNYLGIFFCAIVAAFSTVIAQNGAIGSFKFEIIGAPVFAILIGMIFNPVSGHESFKAGIKFTSKKILQYAVIILGFTLNLGTIAKVGTQCLPVIVSTISISLITAFVMMKILKMDGKVSTLIGVGSSICGGSAIAATAPVIGADDEEVAQSISVIFLFNVLAALIFPTFGKAIGFGTEGFAIFAGTAVNDTSSVTAAASTAESIYGSLGIPGASSILSTAVTVKLTRTLAIIPITLVLAFYQAFKAKHGGTEAAKFSFVKIFPWFILFFIAAAVITSVVGTLNKSSFTVFYLEKFVPAMKWLAKFFIAMAMCAIGMNTNIVNLVKKGGKPILMGLTCWIFITLVSIGVQHLSGVYKTNIAETGVEKIIESETVTDTVVNGEVTEESVSETVTIQENQ